MGAAALPPDACVVEVGPGLGILTEELARHARSVIALEKDRELVAALLPVVPDGVRVINADALEFDLGLLPAGDYHLVANLPYNVASAVLRHFLDSTKRPASCTIMVQAEVADRMIARPPNMNLLAVSMQFHGTPEIAFFVGRGAFTPPPKVTSAVVHVDVCQEAPLDQREFEEFFAFVRAGFATRRKQLKNSLRANYGADPAVLLSVFKILGISERIRPQELNVDDWLRLYRCMQPDTVASTL